MLNVEILNSYSNKYTNPFLCEYCNILINDFVNNVHKC